MISIFITSSDNCLCRYICAAAQVCFLTLWRTAPIVWSDFEFQSEFILRFDAQGGANQSIRRTIQAIQQVIFAYIY